MATGEDDTHWLIHEIERYTRRPPWLNEPDFFDPIDPIFQRDAVIYLAYRGAKRRAFSSTRFDGQALLRKRIQELDNATSTTKEALVMELSKLINAETRNTVTSWTGPNKKKRLRTHSKSTSPPPTGVGVTISDSSYIQSLSIRDTTHSKSTSPSSTGVGAAVDNSSRLRSLNTRDSDAVPGSSIPVKNTTQFAIPAEETQRNSRQHSFSTVSISEAKAILPDQLFQALKKSYSVEQEKFVAYMGMSYRNADDCELTITVGSGNIERFAETLFDLRLQTNDNLRYIYSGNSQITPGTTATICGCIIDVLQPFFGQLINNAIRESPRYMKDIMEQANYTQAVSMEVSHDITDVGVLVIHLNLFQCVNIWNILVLGRPTQLPDVRSRINTATMPFVLYELDPDILFDEARPTPMWVVGRNQQIYWRHCFIRVYTNTNKQFAQASCETCDGQCTVPEGKELFLGGEGGHIWVED
ncbi:hypothetical protein F4802DRAFT_591141 [Xylaria palmicola]|nr:hypothetical protein F4802DRAFT_591141 [Xylaria palmicola]